MIFEEHSRKNDLNCNPCLEKKLNNIRAAGKDESTKLDVPQELELDRAIEWIDEDEWVEITPTHVRIRKAELRSNFRELIR